MVNSFIQKGIARGVYSQLYAQCKLVSVSVMVIMWLIFIITTSIIINNSVDTGTSVLSVMMLLMYLIGMPLYYGYIRNMYEQIAFKNTFHIIMLVLPILILITSSVSYSDKKLTEEQKRKAKTCNNASIALFIITILYYGAVSGLYLIRKDMTIFSLAVRDNVY